MTATDKTNFTHLTFHKVKLKNTKVNH